MIRSAPGAPVLFVLCEFVIFVIRECVCIYVCVEFAQAIDKCVLAMPAVRKYRRDTSEVSCCLKYVIFGFNVMFWVSIIIIIMLCIERELFDVSTALTKSYQRLCNFHSIGAAISFLNEKL